MAMDCVVADGELYTAGGAGNKWNLVHPNSIEITCEIREILWNQRRNSLKNLWWNLDQDSEPRPAPPLSNVFSRNITPQL